MISFRKLLLITIFFVSFFAQAAQQQKPRITVNNVIISEPKPIFIKKEWFGEVIDVPGAQEIVFLGNHEIVAKRKDKKPLIINLSSSEKTVFSSDYLEDLATDQPKKRALFSYITFLCTEIVVYDSISKRFIGAAIDVGYMHGKKWKPCFDEHVNKPASIIMSAGDTGSIVSYDYMNNTIDGEDFISKVCDIKSSKSEKYKYVFDHDSQTKTLISSCLGKFKIDYELKPHASREYQTGKQCLYGNYMCNSDMSFLAYFSSLWHFLKASTWTECSFLNEGDDGDPKIYIMNLATGEEKCLCYDENEYLVPCAMQFHPNNKVLVTMSLEDKRIEYWNAPTSHLLARQQLPIFDEYEFDSDMETFHQYLSFSADGTLLAAVFPKLFPDKCMIFNVPFFIAHEKKCIWLLWCLKNYQYDEARLPKDIVNLIFHHLKN